MRMRGGCFLCSLFFKLFYLSLLEVGILFSGNLFIFFFISFLSGLLFVGGLNDYFFCFFSSVPSLFFFVY